MKKQQRLKVGDWWLLTIFFVLMAQSAYGLFTPTPVSTQVQSVDIVFRTSIAAIFGYIVSSNFGQKSKPRQGKAPSPGAPSAIGFSSDGDQVHASAAPGGKREVTLDVPPPPTKQRRRGPSFSNTAQLGVVGTIALLSLTVLIVWRNSVTPEQAANTAIISVLSQFRDMVSGCVGFLIGHPQGKQAETNSER